MTQKNDIPEDYYSSVSDIPKVIATLRWHRGARTSDDVRRFLEPQKSDLHDPFQLRGMHEAVERIRRAIDNDERTAVNTGCGELSLHEVPVVVGSDTAEQAGLDVERGQSRRDV